MKLLNLIIALCLVSLTSCVDKPEVLSIEKFEPVSLEKDTLITDITLKVKSNSSMKTKIIEIDSKIYIDDDYIGNSKISEPIVLSPNIVTEIALRSNFMLSDVSKFYPKIMGKDSVTIKVEGNYKIDMPISSITVPSTSYININIHEFIEKEIKRKFKDEQIKITHITPKKMGFDGTDLDVKMSIENKFPFEYTVNKINVDIINKNSIEKMGNWTLDQPQVISKNSIKELSFEIHLENMNALKQITDILFKKQQPQLMLKGEAEIKIDKYLFIIPIEKEIK